MRQKGPSSGMMLSANTNNRLMLAERIADRTQNLAMDFGEAWVWLYKGRVIILASERQRYQNVEVWRHEFAGVAHRIGRYLPGVSARDVMDDVLCVI